VGLLFFGKKEVPSLFPTLSNIVLYFQIRGFETVTRCKMCLHHGCCLLFVLYFEFDKVWS
jgi:hypothetical protein